MKRELISTEQIKEILSKYSKDQIKISDHYLKKINQEKREIDPKIIINHLLNENPHLTEKQLRDNELRYKTIYKLSNKYDLIIVITEEKYKTLKVITSYKSSKKVKLKWQKDTISAMKK